MGTAGETGSGTTWDRETVDNLAAQLGDRDGTLTTGILQLFLEQAPTQLRQMDTAALNGDASAVREGAHSLRGSALIIGGTRLAEVCERIERATDAGWLTAEAVPAARSEYQQLAGLLSRSLPGSIRTHPGTGPR